MINTADRQTRKTRESFRNSGVFAAEPPAVVWVTFIRCFAAGLRLNVRSVHSCASMAALFHSRKLCNPTTIGTDSILTWLRSDRAGSVTGDSENANTERRGSERFQDGFHEARETFSGKIWCNEPPEFAPAQRGFNMGETKQERDMAWLER